MNLFWIFRREQSLITGVLKGVGQSNRTIMNESRRVSSPSHFWPTQRKIMFLIRNKPNCLKLKTQACEEQTLYFHNGGGGFGSLLSDRRQNEESKQSRKVYIWYLIEKVKLSHLTKPWLRVQSVRHPLVKGKNLESILWPWQGGVVLARWLNTHTI